MTAVEAVNTGALELYGQVKRVIIGLTNLLPNCGQDLERWNFLSVNRTESLLSVPNQQMFFVDETFDYRQNRILLTLDWTT
jgi:hypothetical protein